MSGELSANTHLSHYRIVSKIGAGGMGQVYLATDTKLERKVALKTLPAEFAANQDRMRRFVQEAKAAAALNHPNIAHVYEIGESDGVHFIAMEYIEGVTLRDKIHRDREPLQKILKYFIQVAEGLAKAHQAGIVHRDLKPDNIMITRDDYAKILDFGLAKLVEPQRAFGSSDSDSSEIATAILRQQSIPGIVMGTVGYMSPEQASGRVNEIDHRSDIFSFGCLLFEAASGKKPFEGKDALDSLHKVVYAPTPQLRDVNPLAPDELQRVVRRCLAKEPNKRYQSMKEVALEIDDLQDELKTQIGLEYRQPATTSATVSGAAVDEGFWVAVLPFKFRGSNVDLEALAEGLTEDIVTGLSHFSYLRVIGRGSTLRYANQTTDLRIVGQELGARYVMEGSLRQAGTKLRLAVQLVDATTGADLWAENYERGFNPEAIFELQDDLVPRIVSTVADQYGALVHCMSESLRGRSAGEYSAHEAVLRAFGYFERISPEEHAEVREILEAAVAGAPGHSDCQAMLSVIYWHEYANGFNVRPDPLGRAHAAARQAVAAAPTNHLAQFVLATVLFYQKNFLAFRPAAERALALNRMDASTTAFLGNQIAYSGDWEYGLALIERAKQLNPHHAGWYHFPALHYAYHRRDYRGALEIALKINMPDYFFTHAALAAVYGQLGEHERARAALRELDALVPNFGAIVREEYGKWFDAEVTEHLIEGLRKAGLEIVDDGPAKSLPDIDSSPTNSEARRAADGFWVAVLPFKYRGANADLEALAEGISEDIVTGLSRFSYLRVIARSSTTLYTGEASDPREVGNALGARYVIEGNLRLSGSTLRVAVQLVDTNTGEHLWSETYNPKFIREAVFELQDDLVPRIVSTIADWYGVLPHSMSEHVRIKPPDQLSPYEAVLRSFGYFERIAPEEHAAVRAALERAVEQAPGNADGWAMLAMMYGEEHRFGFNALPDPLGRSLQAARRAVDAGHANHFAWLALAQALFFRKEFDAFRDAAERAIGLNRMDGSTLEYLGHLIAFSGDWDRGSEVAEAAIHLNPNHPGWYWALPFLDAYRKGEYQTARTHLLKSFTRGGGAQLFSQALLAALYGQLEEREAADKVMREVVAVRRDFFKTVRDEFSKWYLPDLVEQLMDGLRKAGLEVVEAVKAANPPGDTASRVTFTPPEENLSDNQPSLTQSIAVLPFANISADEENEYFCDGLAEELLNALSKIEALRVAARTSAFSFKGKETDIREIGQKLNVSTVLEGSVRKVGNRLRITAQLVNIADGYHLWSERYDREMKDIFDVQDEITLTVVNALKMRLLGEEKSAVLKHYTDDTEAYQLYLKGRFHANRFTREGFQKAVEYLSEAIKKDPHYALAYAGIADAYYHAATIHMPPGEAFLKLKAACAKALELDDALADAHTLFAIFVDHYERKPLEAESSFRRGIELAPKSVFTHQQYGLYLAKVGRFDEAIAELRRSLELDPLSLISSFLLGWTYYFARQPERTKEEARKALEINYGFWMGHWTMALGYEQTSQYAEALAELEEANALDDSSWIPAVAARVYGKLGREDDAQKILDELTEKSKQQWVAPYLMATAYVSLGRRDEAFEWLQKALDEYDEWIGCMIVDPALDELRSDPRFQGLRRRTGLPE